MHYLVRTINDFFRHATVADVNKIRSEIILSDRQKDIFERYYIKKQTVSFIADTLCIGPRVVRTELSKIREKIQAVLK